MTSRERVMVALRGGVPDKVPFLDHLDAGLSIPGDLSVIGNTDIQVGDLLRAPLTTVRHQYQQVARVAGEKLVRMLERGKPVVPEVTRLEVEVIEQASCGPAKIRVPPLSTAGCAHRRMKEHTR